MRSVSWRPIVGCSFASTGCANCAALAQAEPETVRHNAKGLVWAGVTRLLLDRLAEPSAIGGRATIYVCDHGDLFHEATPDAWIEEVFAVMEACPRHVFLILTKRAERQRDFLRARYGSGSAPGHMIFGVSAERQAELDQRAAALAQTPAVARYLTLYPLLEAVDLSAALSGLCMVVAGDEPQRPADPAWFAAIEAQCRAAGVSYARHALLQAA